MPRIEPLPFIAAETERVPVGADEQSTRPLAGLSGWVNGGGFPTRTVGADRIRPNVLELSRPLKGESFRLRFLASPGGVAERSESFKIMIAGGNHSKIKKLSDGTSEPAD